MKKILIVDDLPQNLYMLEILLKSNGYDVDQASNGIEALEIARKDPPEMVVSDILMPGMDGFSLCRAWKADEKLKNIPFIYYTATYTDPKDEKFAMSLGAEKFIVKPMEPDVFLAIIKEIILSQESSQLVTNQGTMEKEEVFFKEYNETLIRKLEDKMMQLQRSNKRLASLYQASCDLHITKPTAELINIVLRDIVETAGYQEVNYFSFDEIQNNLYFFTGIGFSDRTLKKFKDRLVFKLGEKQGLVGWVAQSGQTIRVADTSKEPNWITLDPTIKSALFTPLTFENKLQGVIALFSKDTNTFNEEDEHDISVLANSLAIAIENNRNQENVRKQLTRVSALHNIDIAINSSMDMHTTLSILLDHVINQLKIDAADVVLYNFHAPNLEFAAGKGFYTPKRENNTFDIRKGLAGKAVIERRLIRVDSISDQTVPPEFASVWAAEGFSTYFGAPLIAKGKVVGVLEIYHRTKFDPDPEWMDYFKTLAGQAAIIIDNAKMFDGLQSSNMELRLAYDATIEGWSRAMDLRDKETEGHTQRVTEMTVRLAQAMRINVDQIIHIRRGALLHDIGKLGVPDAILLKPEKLTDDEMVIMRQHPQFAFDMLLPIEYLNPALDIPYCHHERWDGTGYPRGLKGEQIPLAARLFAVIDVWDALRSDRPYRRAWPEDKVQKYIKEQSGNQFDPNVVDKFFSLLSQV
jgi:response regulator RpfG family c-di-GMP phosphodiesterase